MAEPANCSTEQLSRMALFSALNQDQLERVRRTACLIRLEEGQHLFEHNQRAERFYQLKTGLIKLYRLSPSGDEKVIDLIRPGQPFAEAVMFMERHRYPVNAEAILASEVLSFDSTVFIGLLRESVDSCFRLMADMSMRLHHRLNEIDELTMQNATYRLVNYLIGELPPEAAGELDLRLDTPKNIIASLLAIKPETFSRILMNLSKEGIIRVHRSNIHINDVDRLRSFAYT